MGALTISAVNPTNDELTITAHGLNNGDGPAAIYTPIGANPAGAIPGGLAAVTDYWVIVVDANTVKLATSSANALAGTAIDITSAGSGTLELLVGLPFRRARTYTSGSQVKSVDLDTIQDDLIALWNLITGQDRGLFSSVQFDADALYFETPVSRTLNPLNSTDNINGAPGAVHSRSRFGWTFAANPSKIWYALDFLQAGDVITDLTADLYKNTSSGTDKIEIIHTTNGGDFVDTGTTFTNGANAPGLVSLGGAPSPNLTIQAGLAYYVQITPGGTATPSADEIGTITVSYKRPKP